MRLFVLTPEAMNDLKEIFLDIAEDSPPMRPSACEWNSIKDFRSWAALRALDITILSYSNGSIVSGISIRTWWPTSGKQSRFK